MQHKTQMMYLAFGLAIALLLFSLGGCGRGEDSSTSKKTAPSDGTTTESAVSMMEDAGNTGDTSTSGGLTMLPPFPKAPPTPWYQRLSFERSAYALPPMSCSGTVTWNTGIPANSEALDLSSRTCTYTNGSATWDISWSGGFQFVYGSETDCTAGAYGSVNSGLPTGCTITRTTDPTMARTITHNAITRTVTHDTANPSGWDSSVATSNAGVTITCESPSCPGSDSPSGARSISIAGSHLTGMFNGVLTWDHTISTSSPIMVTGAGDSRQITAGTVIVQHNLAHATATVTVTQTLTHESGCIYPIAGEITATFTKGKWKDKHETLSFGPNCGDAVLTVTTGSASAVTLTN